MTAYCHTEKLRDILAHEFCHVLDRPLTPDQMKGPHGPSFKYWAVRLGKVFPYLSIHVGDCGYAATFMLKCVECE